MNVRNALIVNYKVNATTHRTLQGHLAGTEQRCPFLRISKKRLKQRAMFFRISARCQAPSTRVESFIEMEGTKA